MPRTVRCLCRRRRASAERSVSVRRLAPVSLPRPERGADMHLGIYIHFPYCLSKCPYCDFASRAEAVIPQERYTSAVLRELRARAEQFAGREAVSVYFGGGTPPRWGPPRPRPGLRAVRPRFPPRPDAEVTPGT